MLGKPLGTGRYIEVTTSYCLICDWKKTRTVAEGVPYFGSPFPAAIICDECKKRIKKLLYGEG